MDWGGPQDEGFPSWPGAEFSPACFLSVITQPFPPLPACALQTKSLGVVRRPQTDIDYWIDGDSGSAPQSGISALASGGRVICWLQAAGF